MELAEIVKRIRDNPASTYSQKFVGLLKPYGLAALPYIEEFIDIPDLSVSVIGLIQEMDIPTHLLIPLLTKLLRVCAQDGYANESTRNGIITMLGEIGDLKTIEIIVENLRTEEWLDVFETTYRSLLKLDTQAVDDALENFIRCNVWCDEHRPAATPSRLRTAVRVLKQHGLSPVNALVEAAGRISNPLSYCYDNIIHQLETVDNDKSRKAVRKLLRRRFLYRML